MKHGLAGVRVRVDDKSITTVSDSFAFGELGGALDELPNYGGIGRVLYGSDMLARDDENVYRCLRIDITERNAVIGVGNDFRRNLFAGDSAE